MKQLTDEVFAQVKEALQTAFELDPETDDGDTYYSNALAALDSAQPVCGYDDKTGNCTRVNCCKQAQPERAPLSEAELEQEFCKITGLETGINPAAADTKRALVWFKKGYAHGIKQGGQQ